MGIPTLLCQAVYFLRGDKTEQEVEGIFFLWPGRHLVHIISSTGISKLCLSCRCYANYFATDEELYVLCLMANKKTPTIIL